MTVNNTQNDNNSNKTTPKTASKLGPKQLGVIGAVALIVVITGFVAVSMSGSNNKTAQVAQNSASQVNSSMTAQNQVAENANPSMQPNPISGDIQTTQTAAAPNPIVDRYLEITTKAKVEGRDFDPLEATKEEIKQIIGDEALSQSQIKLQKGQEKILKIGYTNSGDEAFKAGTMIVKLDKELKFKREAKDTFDGQTVNLNQSVFVSDNEIKIAKNALSVGQKGEVEVTVIVPEDTPAGEYVLRSMLSEDSSKKGVPGFAYIQVD